MTDSTSKRDPRKVHIPDPGASPSGPPPAAGGSRRARGAAGAGASAGGRAAAGAGTAARSRSGTAAPRPGTTPASKAGGAGTRPRPKSRARKSRRLPRRPKLRRILMLTSLFMPVLLLLVALGGWLYARSIYNKVEKIPLSDVLSASGDGTNYLIVGSDSRNVEDLIDAGLNPEAFDEGGGQRSDTMLLLRFQGGESRMMSIPRDLYVPIAETGGSQKINAAYNGGPRRLILTVQQSLGIPVHHYMEVDFVSFSRLVDSLGGITVNFPNPAFDTHSGLDVQQAGDVELSGPEALAFVRSRHYVEVVDGQNRPDPTADLGRVQRQQQFLSAVFSELGSSRNPLELARAGSSVSGGLRVDNELGLTEAIRLAWRMRSLDPESVELPTRLGSNEAGSVLFLVEPDAEAVLEQFR